MSWARWPAAWKRTCASWLICDVFPGVTGIAPRVALRCSPYCGGLADESKT